MSAPARWTWGAAAWTLVVIGVFYATQIAFAGVYLFLTLRDASPAGLERGMKAIETNGDVLAAAALISTPLCLLALLALVKLKRGATLPDSLALHATPLRTVLRWMGAAVVLVALLDAANWALGRPLVPEVMQETYRSTEGLGALLFVVVIVAPVFEELLFRGFLMTGLESSSAPPWARVALASLVWSLMHMQYDFVDMGWVFVLGLLLGAARVRTGSLAAPIAMHVLVNAVASAETVFVMSR